MPEERKKTFQILFEKGSVDLAVAGHLIHLNADDVDKDVVLFHLQQAAEKLLKALLSKSGVHFEKTHDMIELLDLCSTNSIDLPQYCRSFEDLYPFAVQGRYDFISDSLLDPETYYSWVNKFKAFVSEKIGAQI